MKKLSKLLIYFYKIIGNWVDQKEWYSAIDGLHIQHQQIQNVVDLFSWYDGMEYHFFSYFTFVQLKIQKNY